MGLLDVRRVCSPEDNLDNGLYPRSPFPDYLVIPCNPVLEIRLNLTRALPPEAVSVLHDVARRNLRTM